jgi:hypothetical protein
VALNEADTRPAKGGTEIESEIVSGDLPAGFDVLRAEARAEGFRQIEPLATARHASIAKARRCSLLARMKCSLVSAG